MKKIMITGVSGFLGSHMAVEGLKRGYQVVGTIRNKQKETEVIATINSYVSAEQLKNLSFAYCDLTKSEGWSEAMIGCDAIIHVASPFILELPKHEDDLIIPAKNGVKHVFEAALQNNIQRIVQTSSSVAIMYGHKNGKTNFDETNWTDVNGPMVSPYTKSKTLAEKLVWDYAQKNPQLKVTTINPGFILGPVLGKDPGTSAAVILKMMKGEYPGVPQLGFPTVDVRDVVDLHFKALESESAIGQRYAAVSESIWFKEIAAFVLEAQPSYNKKVKAKELPNWFMKIFALFEKSTKMILPELGFKANISNDKAKQQLGFSPRSAKEAVMATANALVEMKLV
jgi:dihydroflavonol-4-reductase